MNGTRRNRSRCKKIKEQKGNSDGGANCRAELAQFRAARISLSSAHYLSIILLEYTFVLLLCV